ncbi:hypothetical protein [Anaerovibrio sp. RM50]|uniref:hypothetical protein n=1 Tax=Anaerovibrio sp. RM50 TaxID=1200557 RepID=UPI00047F72D4|nr:hypothetical protein [Anaerovibrio sp. RM50]
MRHWMSRSIVKGSRGDAFKILPIKIVDEQIISCTDATYSITENAMWFLGDLLHKYFATDDNYLFRKTALKEYYREIPNYELNELNNNSGRFEKYLTHNVFSYSSINGLIKDLDERVAVLKNENDSKRYWDIIKSLQHLWFFLIDENTPYFEELLKKWAEYGKSNPPKPINELVTMEKQLEDISSYRTLLIIFYWRLMMRFKKMINDNPEFTHITFYGP